MAKMTLLEMTQNILSAMSSDEVNSITDTVEAQQVVTEIKNTYYELYSNRFLSSTETLLTLEANPDHSYPNTLKFPENVTEIKWLKYRDFRDNNLRYRDLKYMTPEEFVQRVIEYNLSSAGTYAEVPILPTSPALYRIPNNKAPEWFTIIDKNNTIVFDSYDATYESYLTGSSTLAWGKVEEAWLSTDDFVPPLDAEMFPHFLAESKSACFINIKEVSSAKEEQRARRQLIRSQNKTGKFREQLPGIFDGVNYARNR